MPVIRHKIKGYEAFKELLKSLQKKNEIVVAWFSGAVESDGKSWCPDCVEGVVDNFNAEELLNKFLMPRAQKLSQIVYNFLFSLGYRWYYKEQGIFKSPLKFINLYNAHITWLHAEPVIEECLSSLKPVQNIHVIYTEVERNEYRKKDCPYRTDNLIKLEKLPSIICIEDEKKSLLENECKDKALLDLLFSDIAKSVTSYCIGETCGIRKL